MILILVIFVIFATTYSLVTPSFEGPDEDSHFFYSYYLVNEDLTKTYKSSIYTKIGSDPLYYIINSGFVYLLNPTVTSDIPVNYNYWHEDAKMHFLHDIYNFPNNPQTVSYSKKPLKGPVHQRWNHIVTGSGHLYKRVHNGRKICSQNMLGVFSRTSLCCL